MKKTRFFFTAALILIFGLLIVLNNSALQHEIIAYARAVPGVKQIIALYRDVRPRQARINYILFGDAQTQGLRADAFGVSYVNVRVDKFTVNHIDALFEKNDLRQFKRVIIQGDINAALIDNNNDIDETKKAFVAYFEHAAKVPLFFHLHTVPVIHPVDKQHYAQRDELNIFAVDLCKKYKKCISIPVPEQLQAADSAMYYSRDGVHLNKAGYALWATRIKSVITAWHPTQH